MNNYKLGIYALAGKRGLSVAQHMDLIKQVGWDATFVDWNPAETDAAAEAAARNGLILQSIHSPFNKVNKMWQDCEEGKAMTQTLIDCLIDCSRHDIPVMVIHPFIGMHDHTPTQIGLDNYARVIEAAHKWNVTLGFENVEGLEYLAAIMDTFKDDDKVRFCYDTGHEMCYDGNRDMMALYGDRLCHTHLNDNFGQREPEITWLDDLHVPMGDGVADWKRIMNSIRKSGYQGVLMCELNYGNKPNRHELDRYLAMEMDEFYAYALECARRVTAL